MTSKEVRDKALDAAADAYAVAAKSANDAWQAAVKAAWDAYNAALKAAGEQATTGSDPH